MKFTVQSPIKHGGERHEVGAEVEMSDKAAKPLLASGDIVPFAPAKKADKKTGNDSVDGGNT